MGPIRVVSPRLQASDLPRTCNTMRGQSHRGMCGKAGSLWNLEEKLRLLGRKGQVHNPLTLEIHQDSLGRFGVEVSDLDLDHSSKAKMPAKTNNCSFALCYHLLGYYVRAKGVTQDSQLNLYSCFIPLLK